MNDCEGISRKNRKNLQIQFSLIQVLFFCVFAATSYQSVYLMEIGMTGQQIGFGTSLGAFAGLLILPIWGMIGDYLGSSRKIFMLSMLFCGGLFLLFPMVVRVWYPEVVPIYIYMIITVLFRQPANAMLDAWAVSELTVVDVGYGAVRMWGSAGYSVVSILLGILIGRVVETEAAFYIMGLFVIPLLVLCVKQKEYRKRESGQEKQQPDFKILIKNRRFLIYLMLTIGLNIYLSVTLIFMGYILEAASCPATLLGVVTGYRAFMEIISMQICVKLRKRISLSAMLITSGFLFGVEHLLYAYCCGIGMILVAMTLSGLAGGIFYSVGPSYVYEIVEPSVRNTAQSIGAASLSLTGILGTSVGGIVIENMGIQTLTNNCGIVILMLSIGFAMHTKKMDV